MKMIFTKEQYQKVEGDYQEYRGWIDEIDGKVAEFEDGKNNATIGHYIVHRTWCTPFAQTTPSRSIHITSDGLTTHAVLKEGGKVVKRVKATCSPNDTYDFGLGAKMALVRLFDDDLAARPKYGADKPAEPKPDKPAPKPWKPAAGELVEITSVSPYKTFLPNTIVKIEGFCICGGPKAKDKHGDCICLKGCSYRPVRCEDRPAKVGDTVLIVWVKPDWRIIGSLKLNQVKRVVRECGHAGIVVVAADDGSTQLIRPNKSGVYEYRVLVPYDPTNPQEAAHE